MRSRHWPSFLRATLCMFTSVQHWSLAVTNSMVEARKRNLKFWNSQYIRACIEPENKEDRTLQENVIIIFLPDDSLPWKRKNCLRTRCRHDNHNAFKFWLKFVAWKFSKTIHSLYCESHFTWYSIRCRFLCQGGISSTLLSCSRSSEFCKLFSDFVRWFFLRGHDNTSCDMIGS